LSSAQSGRLVVIGDGIAGCSVAYHLALRGWNDVVLLEKGELTRAERASRRRVGRQGEVAREPLFDPSGERIRG